MKPVDVICLCQLYDVHALFGPHFERDNPWVRLRRPGEVSDPAAIRHVLAFSPGPGDFAPYTGLEMVSSVGAGVDALLDHPGLRHDIRISRAIIADQARMISGFALWFIVGWQRQMRGYAAQQASETWEIINLTPPSAFRVGVLGSGKIGGQLARSLVTLGFPVTAYGSRARDEEGYSVVRGPEGLAEIAAESHAIVNLLPLTDDTRGILNAEFFGQMRDDSILIQLGRGGHLVEDDLLSALDRGRPARAALDVFAHEPLAPGHPFWAHDRVMVTPHVAGDADFGVTARFIAEGIAAHERGEAPQGLVSRARGY